MNRPSSSVSEPKREAQDKCQKCQNAPEDEVNFCPTDEAFVELPIGFFMPGCSDGGIWDHSEVGVGAHPECIVGEDPMVDILMAKPDTQRVQALLGKAVLWWEQTGFYGKPTIV